VVVEFGRRSRIIGAAAGRYQHRRATGHGLLAPGIIERCRHGRQVDVVDPGLERRWHRVVVQRNPDEQYVRRQELRDQPLLQPLLLEAGARTGRPEPRREVQRGVGEVGEWFAVQVTVDDGVVIAEPPPRVGEGGSDGA
jgi:hypothetical protein